MQNICTIQKLFLPLYRQKQINDKDMNKSTKEELLESAHRALQRMKEKREWAEKEIKKN